MSHSSIKLALWVLNYQVRNTNIKFRFKKCCTSTSPPDRNLEYEFHNFISYMKDLYDFTSYLIYQALKIFHGFMEL